MSDAETLLFIVLAIYVGECTRWLPHEATVFCSWAAQRWYVAWPGKVIGNPNGGLVFFNPLPPLGTAFVTQTWPLSVSPHAALAYTAQVLHPFSRAVQSCKLWPWAEVGSIATLGKGVYFDDELFVKMSTRRATEALASSLETIRHARPEERESVIHDVIDKTFDSRVIHERIVHLQMTTRTLRMMCNVLVAFVFVSGPLLVWTDALWPHWPWLLLALASLLGVTVLDYFLEHRAVYPDGRGERWKHAILMLFSPLTAMRAVDAITFEHLVEFHPLAVARELLSPAQFEAFARRILLDLRMPMLPMLEDSRPEAMQAEAWFRDVQYAKAAEFVEEAGLNVAALLSPPEREGEDVRAFCPRCHQQFASVEGGCAPCGGQELIALDLSRHL